MASLTVCRKGSTFARRASGFALLVAALAACGPSPEQTAQDLASPDPAVRREALDALDEAAQREAALVALADADPAVRGRAVEILGALVDPGARVEAVRRHLASDRPEEALVPVLQRWGPGAVAALDGAAAALVDPGRHRARLLAWDLDPARPASAVLGPLLDEPPHPPTGGVPLALAPHDLTHHADALAYLDSRRADPDPKVRAAVAAWVGAAGDAAAAPLLALLTDRELAVRAAAARSLGPLHDPRIAPALVRAFADLAELEARRGEDALYAAEMAASEDDEPSADVSVTIDMSAEQPLRSALDDALTAQGAAAVRPLLTNDRLEPYLADERIIAIGADAVPALIELLESKSFDLRGRASFLLGRIPDARSVEPLIAALRKARIDEAEGLIVAFSAVGAPAVERCASLLDDPLTSLRRACANIVTASHDPRHAAAIRGLLADREPEVVAAAAYAVGEHRDPAAFDALVGLLVHRDRQVRLNAAIALGQLGDARAAAPLIAAIGRLDESPPDDEDDGGFGMRRACTPDDERFETPEPNRGVEALTALGPGALPAILSALAASPAPPAPVRLIDALAQQPAAAARSELRDALGAALGAKDPSRRAAAARAMVALRPTGWLDALLEAFAREQTLAAGGGLALGDLMMALGRSHEARAAEALIAYAGKRHALSLGSLVHAAIGENASPPARAYLAAALAKRDLETIAGAHAYFVRVAPEGAEAALIAAFDELGEIDGLELACGLINIGNPKVEAAAERWARDAGYSVTREYGAGGGGGRRWGSGR